MTTTVMSVNAGMWSIQELTEAAVEQMLAGANFEVICDVCDTPSVASIDPLALAAIANAFRGAAIEARFDALRNDPPTQRCGACLFQYGSREVAS